jgi:hypothetical protein
MPPFVNFLVSYPQVPGSLLLLLYGAARYCLTAKDEKRTEWFIAATALAVPANMVAQAVTMWLSGVRPLKYDLFIYRIDGVLGFQPSFMVGQLVSRHFWLYIAAAVGYGALPLAMLAVLAAYIWRRPQTELVRLVKTFALNLCAAVPIYALIPVCGPGFAFREFPNTPPHVAVHPILLAAPPNAIPSVHFSTALLIAWFARRWLLGRVLGIAYVVLIAIATLASGQHYLVDLGLAIPYAVSVYFMCHRSSAAERVAKREEVAKDEPAACLAYRGASGEPL